MLLGWLGAPSPCWDYSRAAWLLSLPPAPFAASLAAQNAWLNEVRRRGNAELAQAAVAYSASDLSLARSGVNIPVTEQEYWDLFRTPTLSQQRVLDVVSLGLQTIRERLGPCLQVAPEVWLVLGRQSETGPWHATSTSLTMSLLEAKNAIRALVGDAAFPVGHCLGIIQDDGRTPAALALVGPADGHSCKKVGGSVTFIPAVQRTEAEQRALEAALVAIAEKKAAEQRALEAALVAIAEQKAREAAGLPPASAPSKKSSAVPVVIGVLVLLGVGIALTR